MPQVVEPVPTVTLAADKVPPAVIAPLVVSEVIEGVVVQLGAPVVEPINK